MWRASNVWKRPPESAKIGAGGIYVVQGGVHLQAAPDGRRNLVLIIAPKGVPFVIPGGGQWTPTGFCAEERRLRRPRSYNPA